jgi:hypothetical protein
VKRPLRTLMKAALSAWGPRLSRVICWWENHPQGRNPAFTRRKIAAGHLWREGRRCQRHLPAGPPRSPRNRHRRQGLFPARNRQGRPHPGNRDGRNYHPGAQPRRRTSHHRDDRPRTRSELLVIGKKLAATLKKGKKVFIAKDAAVAAG